MKPFAAYTHYGQRHGHIHVTLTKAPVSVNTFSGKRLLLPHLRDKRRLSMRTARKAQLLAVITITIAAGAAAAVAAAVAAAAAATSTITLMSLVVVELCVSLLLETIFKSTSINDRCVAHALIMLAAE
uniref:Uncharacterized protein n=1 Tax=Glossina austeni TaxID=7395 RepID=A0A1A9UZV2_GLOAU